jgi:hypothetical protein
MHTAYQNSVMISSGKQTRFDITIDIDLIYPSQSQRIIWWLKKQKQKNTTFYRVLLISTETIIIKSLNKIF